MLWLAFLLTIINALLFYIISNALLLLGGLDLDNLSPREQGYLFGVATAETLTTTPPPGAIAETIGAISVPWILIGVFCLLAKLFRKGSFRARMLQASPAILAFALLVMFTILSRLW